MSSKDRVIVLTIRQPRDRPWRGAARSPEDPRWRPRRINRRLFVKRQYPRPLYFVKMARPLSDQAIEEILVADSDSESVLSGYPKEDISVNDGISDIELSPTHDSDSSENINLDI
ncbi:hypothetical protein EVAR_66364_1 [Eumeta japonica]|uniref:Uncharacterized protein n=1 Tax=Eumeta variegata TaxID=151549 RepID=A0A4C1ZJB0_EUMVA|nr:hypothetical protein EVAR_66364_1 [Eumeta japonica]